MKCFTKRTYIGAVKFPKSDEWVIEPSMFHVEVNNEEPETTVACMVDSLKTYAKQYSTDSYVGIVRLWNGEVTLIYNTEGTNKG